MDVISEELVEETWQEFGGLSPKQLRRGMKEISKHQPHLLSFMMELTQDLKQDVIELSIYMFYNVVRMFKKSYPKKINKISPQEIINCHEQNETFIESLEGIHEKFFDRIARVNISDQPYVMKYVVEALIEAPEDENPVMLTEEDTGHLFLLFKTVIDLLNEKTNA